MRLFALTVVVIVISLFGGNNGQKNSTRSRKGRNNRGPSLKKRLQDTITQVRQRSTQTICYEKVGCFDLPHRRSPLQKVPESPEVVQTKFYLLRRNVDFTKPELILYDDDGKSLDSSKFNYLQPLKLIIHGYLGSWNHEGILLGADAYIKLYDCNIVLMDWSKGARGPQYAMAAANTEVVGRELGMLLLQLVERGLNPKDIHLLGFSLGAHVAGTSSEVLKRKGHLIGRITGLDAASPLFRTDHLKEKHKKLDKEDAVLVDVVHTDASPMITDGFGLWNAIGHVDFFPNGGQEQPGCTDVKQSIVVSHFDKSVTRDIACSHIRAWRLFQETLIPNNDPNKCNFVAFSCPGGLKSFEKGSCFPTLPSNNTSRPLYATHRGDIGRFGENVKGEGIMFFLTKASPPYCGTQVQASIHLSQKTGTVKGVLLLSVYYSSRRIDFQISCESDDLVMTGSVKSGLGIAEFQSLDDLKAMKATLSFLNVQEDDENNNMELSSVVYIDKIVVKDMNHNSWQFCGKDTLLEDTMNRNYNFNVTLLKDMCS